MSDIDIRKVKDHYEIYIDGQFYASADDMREVYEELNEIENEEDNE